MSLWLNLFTTEPRRSFTENTELIRGEALCTLCLLCVSVVKPFYHGGTEIFFTENPEVCSAAKLCDLSVFSVSLWLNLFTTEARRSFTENTEHIRGKAL